MEQNSYPKQITPLKRVTRKTDRNGQKYISARMMVGNTSGDAAERTVRIFGPLATSALPRLKAGIAVAARVVFDNFTGEGGRGQTVRVISLD